MQILTANRLRDREVVWLAADHSWTDRIESAEIARNEATAEKLERAGRAALLKNEVIDVNLVDVEIVAGRIHSLRLCEHIGMDRPAIHSDPGVYLLHA